MSLVISTRSANYRISYTSIGVFILYLFHVSAMIGITLGYFDWFASKTPLNLTIMFGLLCWLFPLNYKKGALMGFTFFMVGMIVETLGVQFGLLFGEYSYGANLGFKILGVPFLIGINWALLSFITASIAQKITTNKLIRVVLGAALMVGLDVLIEQSAPALDFWEFSQGIVPMSNYIWWFIIAAVLQAIYVWFKMDGNYRIAKHLFLCQVMFFTFLLMY